jgi:hypothetical protein
MLKYFPFVVFVCPPLIDPPLPPRPFTPAGVKGSWNSQFGFFGPDRDLGASACDTSWFAHTGERGGRSEWIKAWRGRASSARSRVCKVSEANEHTRVSWAIRRAEQRSAARIRLGACLSEASLRPTPGGASSAGYPKGARPWARLFFGYFLLAKQKKVARPTGRNLNQTSGQNRNSKTSCKE